jgi:transcriptional regulator with XRE-family HTH domain
MERGIGHGAEGGRERPGERLKRVREKLNLTYRDVEQASRQIAERRGNDEFVVALSRLADIENKGTAPSIFRIYTLCAVYRLDYETVLGWYGVPRDELESESARIRLRETHAAQFTENTRITTPQPPNFEIDVNKTSFLSHVTRRWGKFPLNCLNGLDLRTFRYGFIGLDDWSMYPILQPGALVAIDENRRKISSHGWTNEIDRPIYFLEHRAGYACGWCSQIEGRIIVQSHPASDREPLIFELTSGVDIIGQVVAVAMPLDARLSKAPRRSPSVPE